MDREFKDRLRDSEPSISTIFTQILKYLKGTYFKTKGRVEFF
jgi:hypothetical protein